MGKALIERYAWNHVVCVRESGQISVYLNGGPAPELTVQAGAAENAVDPLVIGAAPGDRANFEGRLDEVAVYDRAFTASDVRRHYVAAQ
jgi:hypothetical protein